MSLRYIKNALLFSTLLLTFSCKKYVDVPLATNLLSPSDVYNSDASATSAVLALYSYYTSTNSIAYITFCGGMLADELSTSTTGDLLQYVSSTVSPSSTTLESYLWQYPYTVIRSTNQMLAGLNSTTGVSDTTKSRLMGEAYFFRAFYFFNLFNFFGPVPLTTNTEELSNALLPRSDSAAVYTQIIADLKQAESLLPSSYPTAYHARANKYAAAALLARVYLYAKDYTNAAAEATKVIGATDVTYSLSTPANTFINTSPETILQLYTLYGYSMFGAGYRTANNTTLPTYYLDSSFMTSFEPGDTRRTNWVDSAVINNATIYRIYKYKLQTATAGNEYNVVLRLAEQYLIRAEAEAQQSDLADAANDLNTVRTRAGLGGTTAATQTDLLNAILAERKVELFGEFAHRWFDLKRTGQANSILGAFKPATWKATDVLMPIPQTELINNGNLTQNLGY